MQIHLIWAQDQNGGIGKNGNLPWHIPEDLKNFKKITFGSTIVMGRKTWDSLPIKPLPKRRNIILSNNVSEKVLFSGDGGDEVFTGYNRYRSIYILSLLDGVFSLFYVYQILFLINHLLLNLMPNQAYLALLNLLLDLDKNILGNQ